MENPMTREREIGASVTLTGKDSREDIQSVNRRMEVARYAGRPVRLYCPILPDLRKFLGCLEDIELIGLVTIDSHGYETEGRRDSGSLASITVIPRHGGRGSVPKSHPPGQGAPWVMAMELYSASPRDRDSLEALKALNVGVRTKNHPYTVVILSTPDGAWIDHMEAIRRGVGGYLRGHVDRTVRGVDHVQRVLARRGPNMPGR